MDMLGVEGHNVEVATWLDVVDETLNSIERAAKVVDISIVEQLAASVTADAVQWLDNSVMEATYAAAAFDARPRRR